MNKSNRAALLAGRAPMKPTAARTAEPSRQPIAVTIPVALQMCGLGRTTLYSLIANGEIKSVRVGARRLVLFASLQRFLMSREA